MRPQHGDGLRPTAWPMSCRLARALACSTERIFLSRRSMALIVRNIEEFQNNFPSNNVFDANSEKSTATCPAQFPSDALIGVRKLTRPRLVTARPGRLAIGPGKAVESRLRPGGGLRFSPSSNPASAGTPRTPQP